jgi:rhodanese-related sulfurtransferase
MSRTIDAANLAELLSNRGVALVDVRRAADCAADPQIIPCAERRDPENIESWMKGLPKNQTVVLYCARGGSVSNSVLDRLLSEGIQARYLEGGIEAWKRSGRATRGATE